MTFYIGLPGRMFTLAHPAIGIGASLGLNASVQQALAGPRTVDYVGVPKRTYTMTRTWLTPEELGVIEGLASGAFGPGPFALLDPWRRNLLTVNQSSGSDVLAACTDFWMTNGSHVPVSTTEMPHTGMRSVAWDVTATGSKIYPGSTINTDVELLVDPVIMPSLAYTASAWIQVANGTATTRMNITWYNGAGDVISSVNGSTQAMSTGIWYRITCTGTAPGNAGYARCYVENTVMSVAQRFYLDDLMLEQASSVTSWVPGTGVPRVMFTDITDTYPRGAFHDASWTMVEVG